MPPQLLRSWGHNYSHFSATELGVLFYFILFFVVGFHSGTMRRESGTSSLEIIFFLQTLFNKPGKRAIPFPFGI